MEVTWLLSESKWVGYLEQGHQGCTRLTLIVYIHIVHILCMYANSASASSPQEHQSPAFFNSRATFAPVFRHINTTIYS